MTRDAELRSPSFGKLDARECSSGPVSSIRALRSVSPLQRDMTSRSLRPIVTAMDRKSSSDHGDDRKRASQLGRRRRSEARREATHPTTSLSCRDNAGRSSIAMRIASKCFDRENDRVLPIATTIANEQVSCDESRMTTFVDREGDRERVRRSRTRSSTSITTMLANELVDGDEGRLTTFCRSR